MKLFVVYTVYKIYIYTMKTTKTVKNSEYRIVRNGNLFDVWLVSCASGAKLSKVAGELLTEESANEFIQWVKERE